MKALLLFAFLLPITAIAQTQSDYQNVMAKFQRFYNAGKGDSIHLMFERAYQPAPANEPLWTNKQTAEALKQFGTLKSFTFLGVDETDHDKVHVFQTIFSKADTQTTSLTLYENKQLGTFRFITTSHGIDALLKKRKSNRSK